MLLVDKDSKHSDDQLAETDAGEVYRGCGYQAESLQRESKDTSEGILILQSSLGP